MGNKRVKKKKKGLFWLERLAVTWWALVRGKKRCKVTAEKIVGPCWTIIRGKKGEGRVLT